jgi:hypothetical protein
MNVVFDAANGQRNHGIFAGDASQIGMKTDFHIVANQRAAFAGAENDVHKTTQVAVGHDLFFYSSLRDFVSFVERSGRKYLHGIFFKGKNLSVAPEGALAVWVALPSTGFGAKTNLRKIGNFRGAEPGAGLLSRVPAGLPYEPDGLRSQWRVIGYRLRDLRVLKDGSSRVPAGLPREPDGLRSQ